MALFKKVNGERVEMTPEEEQECRDAWAAEDIKAAARAHIEAREMLYPTLGEQLDQIWHELDTKGGIDKTGDWYLGVKAVKDANPKPGGK